MNIDGNTLYPYGTGAFWDITDSTPQPTNFWGMSDWFTVPTSWYCRSQYPSQYQVSPTYDFSAWVFVAKVNFDGTLVFQAPGMTLFGIQQLPITTPPTT